MRTGRMSPKVSWARAARARVFSPVHAETPAAKPVNFRFQVLYHRVDVVSLGIFHLGAGQVRLQAKGLHPSIPADVKGWGNGGIVVKQRPAGHGAQKGGFQLPGAFPGTPHPGRDDFVGKIGEQQADCGAFPPALGLGLHFFRMAGVFRRMCGFQLFLG